jgi:8-oxo-dGTP pyrophosphatase MutT (NUDIX family)
MKQRFLTPSAVILILLKQEYGKTKVLLQKRSNTGFADGLWDLSCSGHVEHGESMTAAVIREAQEELGIRINADKLHFVTLIHKREEERDVTYYNGYFSCSDFCGVPKICEQNKCSDLQWYYIDNLPTDLINDRKWAINAYFNKIPYIEYGWEK